MDNLETPIAVLHRNSGAKMGAFAGWDMPVQYQGIIAEHNHARSEACLFDICHMGELLVIGKNASQELGRLVTHDLENLRPGKCSYGFILNSRGGIMDDLIIYPLQEDRFMLVVNASQKQEDLRHLHGNLSSSVRVTDITMQTGKLDLQGPKALSVLEDLTGRQWGDLKFFEFRKCSLDGLDLIVSRTGYTGELGYEIYLAWDKTAELWEMILKDQRVRPAGLGARDTLRLEAGLPLYGQELNQDHTPAEAGYSSVLKSRASYLGKDRAFEVRECLKGLVIEGRRTPRRGDRIVCMGQDAGTVTSGSFAPSLGHCIALAYIKKDYSDKLKFTIIRDRVALEAHLAALPFYMGTARIKASR